jgi:hypothetical protein
MKLRKNKTCVICDRQDSNIPQFALGYNSGAQKSKIQFGDGGKTSRYVAQSDATSVG